MLQIIPFTQGPVETNAFLLGDDRVKQAVVIDPAWDGAQIVAESNRRGWQITAIWLTHAHFDHIAGAAEIVEAVAPQPTVALHPHDLPLYQMQGGAPMFGMHIDPVPAVHTLLKDGQTLTIGGYNFEVRAAPGHTPGHVLFYCSSESVLFCGDVIFHGSIGRTDLPGSSYSALMDSISKQILSLPDDTRLFPGHGMETTVGVERLSNPYLA